MISMLNGKSVAVCIMQPSLRLVLPDGSIWEANSTPLPLRTETSAIETVFGFSGALPPKYIGLERRLTADELATDAIFVPQIDMYPFYLRLEGYRGQVLSPGIVRQVDGKPAAHYSTVTVMRDSSDEA